jgi:hypothetical protein
MKRWTLLATVLLILAAQFAVAAEARDQFNQNEAVTIDPQKSYIFFRSTERSALKFLREVTADERTAWQAERAEAYARARARYERALGEYRRAVDQCRDRPPPCLGINAPTPVTEESFAFQIPEADNFVSVTRGPQFSREGESAFTYLVAVPPGTYAIYGPIVDAGNSIAGLCLCMGSVRFEAPAGQIVDLGEIRYPALATPRGPGSGTAVEIAPYSASMARPARLAGLPVAPAELRAADKMPNYFGILIDRLAPLPGVLRYERDRVIDARTGQPVDAQGN